MHDDEEVDCPQHGTGVYLEACAHVIQARHSEQPPSGILVRDLYTNAYLLCAECHAGFPSRQPHPVPPGPTEPVCFACFSLWMAKDSARDLAAEWAQTPPLPSGRFELRPDAGPAIAILRESGFLLEPEDLKAVLWLLRYRPLLNTGHAAELVVAASSLDYDEVFRALQAVPYTDPPASLARVERVLEERGFTAARALVKPPYRRS